MCSCHHSSVSCLLLHQNKTPINTDTAPLLLLLLLEKLTSDHQNSYETIFHPTFMYILYNKYNVSTLYLHHITYLFSSFCLPSLFSFDSTFFFFPHSSLGVLVFALTMWFCRLVVLSLLHCWFCQFCVLAADT